MVIPLREAGGAAMSLRGRHKGPGLNRREPERPTRRSEPLHAQTAPATPMPTISSRRITSGLALCPAPQERRQRAASPRRFLSDAARSMALEVNEFTEETRCL